MSLPALWPFGPVDRAPYLIRRAFATTVFRSRSGREQRRALRGVPRKTVEYTTTLADADRRSLRRALVGDLRRLLAIPEIVRFAVIADGLALAAETVDLDPVPAWVAEGALLVLRTPAVGGHEMELVEVASIAGGTVTFTAGVESAWPAGTRVHPALQGRLAAETAANIRWRRIDDVPVVFEVDPGSETSEADGAAAVSFDGREVWLLEPTMNSPIDVTWEQARETVDYDSGPIAAFHPEAFTAVMRQAGFIALDFDEAESLRQLFARLKGAQGEVWMPTFEADLPLAAAAGAGTTSLTVEGTEVAAIHHASTVYKAVAALVDGAWHLNRVTGIAESAGNSVLTLADEWAVEIPAGARVSWLLLWRLASDVMEMTWRRDDAAETVLAETVLTFRALEALPADVEPE